MDICTQTKYLLVCIGLFGVPFSGHTFSYDTYKKKNLVNKSIPFSESGEHLSQLSLLVQI